MLARLQVEMREEAPRVWKGLFPTPRHRHDTLRRQPASVAQRSATQSSPALRCAHAKRRRAGHAPSHTNGGVRDTDRHCLCSACALALIGLAATYRAAHGGKIRRDSYQVAHEHSTGQQRHDPRQRKAGFPQPASPGNRRENRLYQYVSLE